MFEAYGFFAAFTVQILVVSTLHPAWLARFVRAKAEAQLPGWDRKSRERFLALYRAVNAGIALLGLGLLGWLFSHVRASDWDLHPVDLLVRAYVVVQILPLILISLIGAWFKRRALMRTPSEGRRTASLQRRGLFDYISRWTVSLAVGGYFLFATFMIYIQQHPYPGFSSYDLLRKVTVVYALDLFLAYWLLYRRKRWPLETSAYRMHAVGVQIRIVVYSSIALIAYLSLNVTLMLIDMQRWVPFVMSVYIVISLLLYSLVFTLRRQAEDDRQARAQLPERPTGVNEGH